MYKVKDFKAVAGVGDMTYQLLVGEYLLNILINGYLQQLRDIIESIHVSIHLMMDFCRLRRYFIIVVKM